MSYILHLLKIDADNYVDNFSEYDLIARKCSSKLEYINNSLQDFNLLESEKTICRERINKTLSIANKRLSKISRDFENIEWKIIFFRGDNYEDGLSHTRFNTIFLPLRVFRDYSDEELTRLLCHEKIHLFQKIYPTHPLIKKFLSNYTLVEIPEKIQKLIRINPDTDKKIYMNNKKELLCFIYSSANPSCINDVKKFSKYEHPFEQMASEWSKL